MTVIIRWWDERIVPEIQPVTAGVSGKGDSFDYPFSSSYSKNKIKRRKGVRTKSSTHAYMRLE